MNKNYFWNKTSPRRCEHRNVRDDTIDPWKILHEAEAFSKLQTHSSKSWDKMLDPEIYSIMFVLIINTWYKKHRYISRHEAQIVHARRSRWSKLLTTTDI